MMQHFFSGSAPNEASPAIFSVLQTGNESALIIHFDIHVYNPSGKLFCQSLKQTVRHPFHKKLLVSVR
jgi:hypothetical protein